MPEESITNLYNKRQQKKPKTEKDRYYVEISDIKTTKGIIDQEIFSDVEEMRSYLLMELSGIEPGIELTIGKGKEGDKWFPQATKDIIVKEI